MARHVVLINRPFLRVLIYSVANENATKLVRVVLSNCHEERGALGVLPCCLRPCRKYISVVLRTRALSTQPRELLRVDIIFLGHLCV